MFETNETFFSGDALRRRDEMHDRIEGRNGSGASRPLHRADDAGRRPPVRVRVPVQAVQEDRPHVGQSVLHRIRI